MCSFYDILTFCESFPLTVLLYTVCHITQLDTYTHCSTVEDHVYVYCIILLAVVMDTPGFKLPRVQFHTVSGESQARDWIIYSTSSR